MKPFSEKNEGKIIKNAKYNEECRQILSNIK